MKISTPSIDLTAPGPIGKTTPAEGWLSPAVSKGPAALTTFAGTVTAVASTTVTFSSAADAILAGYDATNPVLGVTLISNALTRYIVSWTNSTTCVVYSSVTWAGTAITSVQLPIATFVNSAGVTQGWMNAAGQIYIAGTTTFGASAAAAGVTLAGTTLAADGTDAAIDINITPKGTGEVNITKVDIDAGTIDGATIATSNITVGAGKTLDVSAGTFTLANDQISGDKVEGGTIAAITITALTTTTAADNTSTTQAATTAFVQRALYLNAPMYYGISWDESADTYSRTGKTAGYACGKTLSEALLPIQSMMRRCVISDAGVVQYYLFGTNSAFKENGITASVLTGADGQVMVEIPKFYYKHTYVGTVHTWEISPIALGGFDVHPAFMSGATELNYIYVGAYEGVLWDNSAGAYVNYNAAWEAANDLDPATDKLSSVSGFIPQSSFTRATGRAIAALRGTGWSQELYDIRSAVQLLYLIEYASFNSQSMIGLGICNVNDWAGFGYYPFAPTGNSNSIGNATGNNAGAVAGYAAEATKYMSYRGIEHFFGHIWKWLDGINTNSNRSYVCNVAVNLADNTTSNYTDIGINNKNDDGYQNTLFNISRGFLPAAGANADAATKITDYYYQAAGWRVALCGGGANNGLAGGVFFLRLNAGSSDLSTQVGARVCFRK